MCGGWRGDAADRAVSDRCIVALHLGEDFQGGFGARAVALGFQAHAHDAVECESQEADKRMGANTIRQAVVNRRDLDVGFQYSEAALDIP